MPRDRLLALFDPARSMALYIIGTAALTVLIATIYDAVKEWAGLAGAVGFATLLVVIVVIAVGYPLARRTIVGGVGLWADQKPAPSPGLIVLVSPHLGTAPAAIDPHLGTLRVCWLVTSPDSYATADALAQQYRGRVSELLLGPRFMVDPDAIETTFDIVTRILEREAPDHGLTASQVIGDISGGQKPMTAGMALACLAAGARMQYMKAKRDERGEPDRAVPAEPIEIDASLYLRTALTREA
jgi:hypothetical protein